MTDDPIVGHKTMMDGTRQPLHKSEADALWEGVDAAEAKRKADMPTARDALSTICSARTRLEKLGWRDGIYCPKDGSEFAVCQVGSTGMWCGFYQGEWPTGHLISSDCASRPEGMFWKPLADLTAEETAHMEQCDGDVRTMIDTHLRAFGDLQGEPAHD